MSARTIQVAGALLATLALTTSLAACGSGSSSSGSSSPSPSATSSSADERGDGESEDKDADGDGDTGRDEAVGGGAAADVTTCRDQAQPASTPYGEAFPEAWPFPPRTVVFDVQDRGRFGTVVTGVSSSSFRDILAFMNHDVTGEGFEVESGETERNDAEAEWRGHGFRGRWAIRRSASCAGETVIQVLSTDRGPDR